MSKYVISVSELEALYGNPAPASIKKVAKRLTPTYQRWIEASRFCVLSTVGSAGTDGSPRGDDGPVVQVIDPGTLAMPDWRGNNRMDSLRNIVEDGRLSLMFMVPGNTIAVRVNGMGKVTVDPGMLARFSQSGQHPRSVVVIEISEIYFQCSRALMRSGLWQAHDSTDDLPSAGDILADVTGGAEGGAQYDEAWPARAKASLW